MSDDFTDEQIETIAQGVRDLGLIDARMMALKDTIAKYPEQNLVAVGIFGDILDDALELLLAWQDLTATPFGALYDPRVDRPEEDA